VIRLIHENPTSGAIYDISALLPEIAQAAIENGWGMVAPGTHALIGVKHTYLPALKLLNCMLNPEKADDKPLLSTQKSKKPCPCGAS